MTDTITPLPPGSTIGILGGGQLGRMLALAAARLGLHTHIYAPEDPDTPGPAAQVATTHTNAPWDDADALAAFADSCGAVTYEWENIPLSTAQVIATSNTPLRPGLAALRTAQDRLVEKTTLSAIPGVRVALFREVGPSVHDLHRASQYLGYPCVLKTRRGGYDGKGQRVLRFETDLQPAWDALDGDSLGGNGLILEAFVEFTREVSVIATRGQDGPNGFKVEAFPLVENVHRDAVLHTSTAPAANDTGEATRIAASILEELGYVGTMGVEFFDTVDGLVVNEIAPRVHNSGHWTQDAGCTDQFENHIRAVAGWPLGDTTPRHAVRMTNLIGEDAIYWQALAAENARLHLYGKRDPRPGRKMGHINRLL